MPKKVYSRHRRHSSLRGLNRGTAGRKRLRHADAFYSGRAANAASGGIGDTGASVAFTAAASDIVTSAAHGLSTGQGPFTLATDDTLPSGLSTGVNYWVEVIDANTFYLHTSRESVTNSSARVDISDAGTGNHTYTLGVARNDMATYVEQGVPAPALAELTDVDDVKNYF